MRQKSVLPKPAGLESGVQMQTEDETEERTPHPSSFIHSYSSLSLRKVCWICDKLYKLYLVCKNVHGFTYLKVCNNI